MQLPAALRQQKAWALTEVATKMPCDLEAFARTGFHVPWSIYQGHLLYDYATVQKVLNDRNNHDMQPAYRLNPQSYHLIVDIEPLGRVPTNPYRDWPFIYLEQSRHGGLHGILPISSSALATELPVVKDKPHETEFLLNKHFITFTNNTFPVAPNATMIANSSKFQTELKDLLHELHPYIDHDENGDIPSNGLDAITARVLTTREINHVYALDLTPKKFTPDDDKSVREFTWATQAAGELLATNHYRELNDLLAPLRFYADLTFPKRRKHARVFYPNGGPPTTWLDWTLFQAASRKFNEYTAYQTTSNKSERSH